MVEDQEICQESKCTHESILEEERHKGGEGPKGKPVSRVHICESGRVLGSDLSNTPLTELTEISSLKIIGCKSLGSGGRNHGSYFLFSFPFLRALSSITSNN